MIDKSGSMETPDCAGGNTRWKFAKEYAVSIANKAATFDENGIDVVLFASTAQVFKSSSAQKVEQIFAEHNPGGSTDTAGALKLVLDDYNARKNAGVVKPILVVIVTDGVPNDSEALKKVIVDHANSIAEDSETGISFVQIGKDAEATKFLKQLDDDLPSLGAKFDIVDCKNEAEMENISITDILELAIAD